jgi:hypothetical protein
MISGSFDSDVFQRTGTSSSPIVKYKRKTRTQGS